MLDDHSVQSYYEEEEPTAWNGDEYSNADDTTITESVQNKYKRKSTIIEDVGRFCVKVKHNKRRIRIEGYSSSNIPGVPIRNAVTGIYETDFINRTKHAVGSIAEDLYFKVIMLLDGLGPEPRTLFYDNIDQYERHFHAVVNNDVARKWHEKNFAARQEYERQQEAMNVSHY
jgi:hypothetical protein